MDLSYYLFATYVFVLACIIAIICKYMFADVKRQRKMLDETESKLLKTYQSLEEVMDEFYDVVAESTSDIEKKYKSLEQFTLPPARSVQDDSVHAISAGERRYIFAEYAPPPQPEPGLEQSKAAEPDIQDQIGFDHIFTEIYSTAETPAGSIHDRIAALAGEGKNRAEIAKILNITQNEVDLVISMNKNVFSAK